MQDLTLCAGPALIARRWESDEGTGAARLIEVDFTARAHELLFELVTLDADLTLGDFFRLMERSPLLRQVFFREFAEELCAEARKGPVGAAAQPAALERIEYLELYQQWGLDTSTQVYSSRQRLHLHGVGPERARHPDVTLGQVIDGLLWELSFHGGPQEQVQVAGELHQQLAAIDAGTAELVSADDFFDDLDRPGCEALFENLGGQSVRDISRALRDIDDDENVAAWDRQNLRRLGAGQAAVSGPNRARVPQGVSRGSTLRRSTDPATIDRGRKMWPDSLFLGSTTASSALTVCPKVAWPWSFVSKGCTAKGPAANASRSSRRTRALGTWTKAVKTAGHGVVFQLAHEVGACRRVD